MKYEHFYFYLYKNGVLYMVIKLGLGNAQKERASIG